MRLALKDFGREFLALPCIVSSLTLAAHGQRLP
jgi:hypothetical protein